MEQVTREEWRYAHAHDCARIWDGRRYILRLNRATGSTVWREVEMIHNVSRPYTNEHGQQIR